MRDVSAVPSDRNDITRNDAGIRATAEQALQGTTKWDVV
jgi:hypothetical protein